MRKKTNRIKVWLLALIFSLMSLQIQMPVYAEETKGSILFEFEQIPDATFRLYKVATLDENDEYVLTEAFADMPSIDLHEKTAAETLQKYVIRDEVEADVVAVTDSEGKIYFADLEKGAYLILGEDFTRDGKMYTANPVFLSIPGEDINTKEIAYDMKVEAKYFVSDITPDDQETEIKVLKVWKDDDAPKNTRPKSITVQLCNEDGVYAEIELNKDNNWTNTWPDLDASKKWFVTEKDKLDSYKVEIVQLESTYEFVITNTYETPDNPPETDTPEDSPKLPQTGQLWWPVGLMVCFGLLFIIIGVRINSRKE